MLLVDTNAMIFGMPSALFPALASEHFHGGSATFGLLTAAAAFGAIVGAATSGWTGHLRRPSLVVISARPGLGRRHHGVRAGDQPVAGAGLPGAGGHWRHHLRGAATLLQLYTPDQLRGRVSSLYLAQVGGSPALGNVEAGGVAKLAGLEFSIVSGGLACIAGALLLGMLIPALRTATLQGPAAGDGAPGDGPPQSAEPATAPA